MKKHLKIRLYKVYNKIIIYFYFEISFTPIIYRHNFIMEGKDYFEDENGKKYDLNLFKDVGIEFKDGKIRKAGKKRYFTITTKTAKKIMDDLSFGVEDFFVYIEPEVKQREVKEVKEFKYSLDKSGFLTHYIGGLNLDTSDTKEILGQILPVIADAKKNQGLTNKARVHIKLNFKTSSKQEYYSKTFNGIELGKFVEEFLRMYNRYIDMHLHPDAQKDYTKDIDMIIITFIPENRGGCNPTKHPKRNHKGDVVLVSPLTNNMQNNCLFMCLKEYCNFECKRFKEARGNRIRREFGLLDNSQIPISIALKIFEKYKKEEYKNHSLFIIDEDSIIKHESDSKLNKKVYISLKDNHYTNVEFKDYKKCPKCLKKYIKKHNCSISNIGYVENKIKKKMKRRLITATKYEKVLNNHLVIHYDIETYPDVKFMNVPYIVGYIDILDGRKFKYFAGVDCMRLFFKEMLRIAEVFEKQNKKIFINAYNGANFDHYELYKEYLDRNIVVKTSRQNGAIIVCEYKNIKFFDIKRHVQGGLKDNLKAFKCKIQKGDFDHNRGKPWEEMDEKTKADCLKYLRADVEGLKELYDKLNTSIFQNSSINITSYVSTSSLSYDMWKRSIHNKYDIHLPTIQQEAAFRASVRGGRCYKSKSEFKSKDYDAFMNEKIDFEDIKDYMIDADVVSLYPASMMYEYPIGECFRLAEGTKCMEGKMGIYYIKYKTNKRLAHPVLGRREDKTGKLIWDLNDSEGWYTSVEIQDAIKYGYQVEILDGWYWKETSHVFKHYIKSLFELKKKLAKEGKKGSVEYLLSKLNMNSLYGKTVQRPIYSKTINISSIAEYWKFFSTHIITDIFKLRDGIWEISGSPIDTKKIEKQISKPTQFGAFILAYSRRIMLNYMNEANPYFDHKDKPENMKEQIDNDFYYTDTDSLQMHQKNAHLIKNLGCKDLGAITDDLGDGNKIIRALWISPKLYMLEYLSKRDIGPLNEESQSKLDKKIKKGLIKYAHSGVYIKYHFRGKGLNKSQLSPTMYEKMNKGESIKNVREFQIKKINVKRNSKQQHIPRFSTIKLDNIEKIVNSQRWKGREFCSKYQYSVPYGSTNSYINKL